jgi:hypothetical protein
MNRIDHFAEWLFSGSFKRAFLTLFALLFFIWLCCCFVAWYTAPIYPVIP